MGMVTPKLVSMQQLQVTTCKLHLCGHQAGTPITRFGLNSTYNHSSFLFCIFYGDPDLLFDKSFNLCSLPFWLPIQGMSWWLCIAILGVWQWIIPLQLQEIT
jgi:hypothetical protein